MLAWRAGAQSSVPSTGDKKSSGNSIDEVLLLSGSAAIAVTGSRWMLLIMHLPAEVSEKVTSSSLDFWGVFCVSLGQWYASVSL